MGSRNTHMVTAQPGFHLWWKEVECVCERPPSAAVAGEMALLDGMEMTNFTPKRESRLTQKVAEQRNTEKLIEENVLPNAIILIPNI